MFKVNNKDTETTPMASLGVNIVNFEYISHLALMLLLLTFNMQLRPGISLIKNTFFTACYLNPSMPDAHTYLKNMQLSARDLSM